MKTKARRVLTQRLPLLKRHDVCTGLEDLGVFKVIVVAELFVVGRLVEIVHRMDADGAIVAGVNGGKRVPLGSMAGDGLGFVGNLGSTSQAQ